MTDAELVKWMLCMGKCPIAHQDDQKVYRHTATRLRDLLKANAGLRAEVEAWRAWEVAEKLIGTDDEVDVNANNHWSFVELARAANDAAGHMKQGQEGEA